MPECWRTLRAVRNFARLANLRAVQLVIVACPPKLALILIVLRRLHFCWSIPNSFPTSTLRASRVQFSPLLYCSLVFFFAICTDPCRSVAWTASQRVQRHWVCFLVKFLCQVRSVILEENWRHFARNILDASTPGATCFLARSVSRGCLIFLSASWAGKAILLLAA